MEQLIKIEELLDSKENREIGQAMLKRYMDDMTPVDPDSFIIGRKYNLLVGSTLDKNRFGIVHYEDVKFTGKVRYGELVMIIFKDDDVFTRSDYILQAEESTRLSSQ